VGIVHIGERTAISAGTPIRSAGAIRLLILDGAVGGRRRKQMGKPRMIGMNKTYVPNSKADQRSKRFKRKGRKKNG
jgi:hypothetical protein